MRTRFGLLGGAFVVMAAVGCGASHKKVEAPALAQANTEALGTMVQSVEAEKQSDRDRAITLLRQAIAKDPSLWEAHYNLGVLLARKNDLAGAEPELAKAAELAPNAEDVALALGEVRRRRGDPGAAADGLAAFVRSFPDAIASRMALVAALRESGRLDEAIKNATELLKRRPNDPVALSALALAHVDKGEMDAAELLSTEALKGDKKTAVAERTAALVALKRGDDAIAFQHFVSASELDPKDITARLNMGVVLLQAGVYPRAEKEFRAVRDVEPENDDAAIGLAAALRGQGKRESQAPYREAEKILKDVLDREPHDLAAMFNLAVLYEDFLARPADARPLLERFLDEAPDKHPARPVAEKYLADDKAAASTPDTGATPAAAKKPAKSAPAKK